MTADACLVLVPSEAYGFTEICWKSQQTESPTCPLDIHPEKCAIETPFYTVKWNQDGQFTSIYDKEYQREILLENGLGNVLELYEDRPLSFDAWDIDVFYEEKCEILAADSIELVEIGPLEAVLRLTWHFRHSSVTQLVTFFANSRRIDFQTEVDWHEKRRLLKVGFHVNIRTTKASYDVQYAISERPTHRNTQWDFARFESVGHFWADVSDNGYGVALLNDCKYGYGIYGTHMTLSLLKSGQNPDPQADMGHHKFLYSLYPHPDCVAKSDVLRQGHIVNKPLHVFNGRLLQNMGRLIYAKHPGVVIDAIKRGEEQDVLVVRVHECRGQRVNTTLYSDYPIIEWTESNLLEKSIDGHWQTQQEIPIDLKPFQINTYLLRLGV